MRNQLSLLYPKLQHINHLFTKAVDAMTHRQTENVQNFSKTVKHLLIEAFQDNDAELFACIVHHALEFAKEAVKQGEIDKIGVAFELDGEQTLDVVRMINQGEEPLAVHLLVNRFNFPKHTLSFNKKKEDILPFRARVMKTLEAHGVSTELASLSTLSVKVIEERIDQAVEEQDITKLKHLMKSWICLLDELYISGNAKGYAMAVHCVANKINKLLSDLTLLVGSDSLNVDAPELGIIFEFLQRDQSAVIEWALTYMLPLHANAKEMYNAKTTDLVGFRLQVANEFLSLHADKGLKIEALLPDFTTSLKALDTLIVEQETRVEKVLLAVVNCLAVMHKDIGDQNIDGLCLHLQQFVALIMRHRDDKNVRLLGDVFDVDVESMSDILKIADEKLAGYLAWLILTHGLEMHDIAHQVGMSYEDYQEFKKATYAKLATTMGPLLPTASEFGQAFEKLNQRKTSPEVNLNKLLNHGQYKMLLEEAYLSKDAPSFIEAVKGLLQSVEKVGVKNAAFDLIQLLNLTCSEMQDLFKALNGDDETAKLKALVDISLRQCNDLGLSYFSDSENGDSSSPKPAKGLYPFDDWRRDCTRENFSLYLGDFQVNIYKALNIDHKESNRGSVYQQHHAYYDYELLQVSDFKGTLEAYQNELTEALEAHEFDKIKEKAQLRYTLYSYAVYQNDEKLFQALILDDVECLKLAQEKGLHAEVAVLMHLTAEQLENINVLHAVKAPIGELRFAVLDMLELNWLNVYGADTPKSKPWNMKKQVYKALKKLDDEGCAASGFAPLFQEFKKALVASNLFQWSEVDHRLELLFHENMYSLDENAAKVSQRFAVQIKLLLDEAYKAHQAKPTGVSLMPLADIAGLDEKMVFDLLSHQKYQVLAWYVLNNEIFKHFVLANKLSLKKANAMKDSLSIQLEKLLSSETGTLDLLALANGDDHSGKVGLLRTPHAIAADVKQAASEKDYTNIKMLGVELYAVLMDSMQRSDVPRFVKAMQTAVEVTLHLHGEKQELAAGYFVSALKAHDEDQDEALGLALSEKDTRLLTHCMLANLGLKSQASAYGAYEQITEFLKCVYTAFDPKIIITTDELKVQGQTFLGKAHDHKKLATFGALIAHNLGLAYETQNVDMFASMIKEISQLIMQAYANNQHELILDALDPTKKNLYELTLVLESNHSAGLQDWLMEHYISEHHGGFGFHYESQDKEFKGKVHKALDIEAFDLLLVGKEKLSAKIDFKEILESMRRKSNQGVDLLKHQTVLNMLAKIPEFHNLLEGQKPEDSDHQCYHRLFEMMQAIWHCHIAGHVYGMLKPTIDLNGFQSKWEGSMANVMIEHIQSVHKDVAKEADFKEKVTKLHQRYFASIEGFTVDNMLEALNKEVSNGIVLEDKPLSQSSIEQKLQDGEVIAVPVHLLEPGANVGHLVSAVFYGNKVMISDRGNIGFTGMTFFDVGNPEQLKHVIAALASTSKEAITDKMYGGLKDSLKLQPCDDIHMPGQLMGNCGMASSAEPIHLATMYFKCYEWAKKSGRDDDDAMSVANYVSQVLHQEVKHGMQQGSVNDLLAFFGADTCSLKAPRELLAHMHQVAMYKLHNKKIVRQINESHTIDYTDKDKAYEEIKSMIEMSLSSQLPQSSRAKIHVKDLENEAQRLLDLYLKEDIDPQELIREFELSAGKLSADTPEGLLMIFANSKLREITERMTPRHFYDAAQRMFPDHYEDNLLFEARRKNEVKKEFTTTTPVAETTFEQFMAKYKFDALNLDKVSVKLTPLTKAIFDGKDDFVVRLLTAGACPAKANGYGRTPKYLAEKYGSPLVKQLVNAAIENPKLFAEFAQFMQNGKFNLEQLDKQNCSKVTPLTKAIHGKRKDIVELLLALGANPKLANGVPRTPMQLAKKYGGTEIEGMIQEAIDLHKETAQHQFV